MYYVCTFVLCMYVWMYVCMCVYVGVYVRMYMYVQGGSNMTGTDFFVTIIYKPLLVHVGLQRTPLRSHHIFSNVLEASWCPNCLASLIWAFRRGRNQLAPNRDCTADVSEGSISISGEFPLLFWPYGGVHCLEGKLPAFHLSSAWIGSFPSRLFPGGLSNKLHWLFWYL